MPDEIDRAQGVNEQHQLDALGAWRRRQSAGPGRKTCLECGEEIPEGRRRAVPGCEMCVACQAQVEADRKRGL